MENEIKDFIQTYVEPKVIKRGISLFQSNAVRNMSLSIDGNKAIAIANVKGSHGDIYKVDIRLAFFQTCAISIDHFCTCPYSNGYFDCCKHIVAVLIALSKRISINKKSGSFVDSLGFGGNTYNAPPFISSSVIVDNLSQDIQKPDVCQIELGPQSINLCPEFQVIPDWYNHGSAIIMKCRIVAGKSYVIKDLNQFTYNFNHNSFYEYGKYLAFKHDINMLTDQSKQLFRVIARHYYGSTIKKYDRRWLEMDTDDFDMIFSMYLGKQVKFCNQKTLVVDNDPSIKIKIDGVDIVDWILENTDNESLDREELENELKEKNLLNKTVGAYLCGKIMSILMEGQNTWVFQDSTIYKCSKKFSAEVLPILKSLGFAETCCDLFRWDYDRYNSEASQKDTYYNDSFTKLTLGEQDFTKFCHLFLPVLEQWNIIDDCNVDFSEYKPIEPSFKFYLSYHKKDDSYSIKPRVKYSHDELMFFDKTSEFRDISKETKVMNEIERYFDVFGMGYSEHAEKLGYFPDEMICNTSNKKFALFSKGLSELSLYGDIYRSKNWKDISIKEPSQINIDMSINDGLIEFSVTSENMSDSEIVDIIQHYKLDNKYFVNEEGQYVYLDNKQIKTLADITDTLNLDPENLSDIKIPLFRALYLDEKIADNSGLRTKRDKAFKELITRIKSFQNLDIDVPDSINADLRNYQKEGFRWLTTLCQFNLGAILADDMGLGKTLQAISVIVHAIYESRENKSTNKCSQKCLIVCPASLVYNWKDEFKKFAPLVDVSLVSGNAQERKIALSSESDVYVTSYNSLVRDISYYKDTRFSICILDEAQYIKNSNTKLAKTTKKINSTNRFVLTGTPIENNLGDLWSIFDFIMPGYLHSKRQFNASFTNKIKKEDKDALAELQKLVSPFILRRLKQDVLTELPDKIENVLTIDLLPDQRKLYDANVELMRRDILTTDKQEFKTKAIKYLAMLMKLRQICCSPEMLHYSDDDINDIPKFASGKVEATIEVLSDCIDAEHKVLVFSQFTSMLEILQRDFSELLPDANYLYLSGKNTKEQRRNMVKQFQAGNVDVFFISLKAGGTGLNLTQADRVIHVDPWWNYAAEQQATDRTHRIGQHNSVYVTKLVAKNTIEEKIIQLQNQKKKLSEAIVGIEESSSPKFNKEELLSLLE